MTTPEKKPILHTIGDYAKDILTVVALLGLIITGTSWAIDRTVKDFLEIPDRLGNIEATLAANIKPRLLQFQGVGKIVDASEAYPGGYIEVLYFLKREASCDAEILIRFYDVDKNRYMQAAQVPAIKADITEHFTPFPIRINIPESLPEGRYVYHPDVIPKKCGVYKKFRSVPTEIFTVQEKK